MDKLTAVALLLAGAWCALAVHEVGHLLAGLLMRWRVGVVALGPVWLARQKERLRIRWNRLPATWGGIAMVYPRDGRGFAVKATVVAAGGPITSLLVALVAYDVAAAALPGTHLARFALSLSIMSAAVLLATAQPFGTGLGGPSDGGRVLMFFWARPQAEAWAAVWPMSGLSMAKVRPRDWDSGFIRLAAQVAQPAGSVLVVKPYLLRHWLDRGDPERAAAVVDEMALAYRAAPKALRADAAAELAFYLAYYRRDVGPAEHYLAAAQDAEPHRFARAQAAVALRLSDRMGAEAALRRARKALAEPQLESTDLDADLVEAVRRELHEGAPTGCTCDTGEGE